MSGGKLAGQASGLVDRHPGNRLLRRKWTPAGPPVEAPETTGFGSRVIGLGICNSRDVSIAFDPAGVQARFRAPLADVRDS